MAALNTLPNELLSLIASRLDRPRDVVSLALSSRRLHEFAKLDGWKAFLRGRLGVVGLDSDAATAAHGMTRLHRNWNRKAFIVRYVDPSQEVTSLNSWESKKWTKPQGQTLGYRPSIDSYEEIHGAWVDRREVLAFSAGTHVVLRVKETGMKSTTIMLENHHLGEASGAALEIDQFEHSNSWYSYQKPESFEGMDDVTALKLLQPHQKAQTLERVVVGTASGQLSVLDVDFERRETTVQAYETERGPVGSLSVSRSDNPLIAAAFSVDGSLAIYPVEDPRSPDDTPVELEALSVASPVISRARGTDPGSVPRRIWTCDFISHNTIAVALGQSDEPIHVYEVTPTGISPGPIRKFNLNRDGDLDQRNTSVYPVVPIPHTEDASATNNLFLSGCYDGIVRLHDMRSPRNYETTFKDVTNYNSIYSIACQGFERFVVGGSAHSMIKVYDLRFSGSYTYDFVPPVVTPRTRRQGYVHNAHTSHASTQSRPGWNVYLNPRAPSGQPRNRRPTREIQDSPVYSLSIPSATSPNVYAGLEGMVQNLTVVSVLDQHPDPLLADYVTRVQKHDPLSSWNPFQDVLNLGMYEQGTEELLDMNLLIQDGVSPELSTKEGRLDFSRRHNLDERWRDPRDDGEKWVRGQEPQQVLFPHGRGGGRGRRRGWNWRGGRG